MLEIEQAIYLKQNVNFLKFRHFQRQIKYQEEIYLQMVSLLVENVWKCPKWPFNFCSPNHKTPTSTLQRQREITIICYTSKYTLHSPSEGRSPRVRGDRRTQPPGCCNPPPLRQPCLRARLGDGLLFRGSRCALGGDWKSR